MKNLTDNPSNASTSSNGSGELEPARCGAKKRDGTPCRKFPMLGGRRCRLHGGASPQAVAKARERILGAADLAAQRLIEFMNDKRVPWPVRLSAARDLLDRAGLHAKTGIELEIIPPWQEAISRIVVDDPRAPELPAGPSDQEAWDATEAEQDAAWDRACSPQRSTPVVYQPASRPADHHEADQHAAQQRVEPASFDSKPPARLDPDGLARRTAPRRRNREP